MLSDCDCLEFGQKASYRHSDNNGHGSEASLVTNPIVTTATMMDIVVKPN